MHRAVLKRFSRLVADATTNAEIFPELVASAIDVTNASGAAAIEVGADGIAHVVASRNLDCTLASWSSEIDDVGDVVVAFSREGSTTHARPMISDRGLFGVLVFWHATSAKVDQDAIGLVEALADLTAAVLEKNFRLESLSRAHAELRATQRALAQAEKLRALGEMAAGVAHDLKNVINPLSLHIQVIERANKKDNRDEVAATALEIKEILRRGVRTIDRLRDYGRREAETPAAAFDVDAAMEEVMTIARPRLSRSTTRVPRIVSDLASKTQYVGHREEIVSAVVNLAINAIDALTDRAGAVTIRTRATPEDVIIEVSDDGPGMPAEVERRAFEPFFTTKGEAGTGLGLAMVYACVRRHAGSVELVTGEGKGTTFTLKLPHAQSS
jgi:signal transduction histidine kinase